MCACVHILIRPCVYAGVRAYPPVCVCTFLGSARELTDAEKPPTITEETDIDAEEVNQVPAAEDLNPDRGVTDLDATPTTPEANHSENKVDTDSEAAHCSNHNLIIFEFLLQRSNFFAINVGISDLSLHSPTIYFFIYVIGEDIINPKKA